MIWEEWRWDDSRSRNDRLDDDSLVVRVFALLIFQGRLGSPMMLRLFVPFLAALVMLTGCSSYVHQAFSEVRIPFVSDRNFKKRVPPSNALDKRPEVGATKPTIADEEKR